ncbi:MAG: spermidine/putrescine transport system substrate-binding protein, partial [Rhodospirillaceae bacterium]|nr:spermidine/putrescine transport system substrate-binding protein [Rhodospirillaceae bacterium]
MDESKRYERLIERYRNGGMERREFLGLLGLAGMAAGIVGGPMSFLSRTAQAASSIRYDG